MDSSDAVQTLLVITHHQWITHHWRPDASGVLSIDGELLPTEFALHQNYPNPFNPTTTLRYDLPQDSHVLITIYDIRGRKVKTLINENQNAGYRITQWNATNDFGQPISASRNRLTKIIGRVPLRDPISSILILID